MHFRPQIIYIALTIATFSFVLFSVVATQLALTWNQDWSFHQISKVDLTGYHRVLSVYLGAFVLFRCDAQLLCRMFKTAQFLSGILLSCVGRCVCRNRRRPSLRYLASPGRHGHDVPRSGGCPSVSSETLRASGMACHPADPRHHGRARGVDDTWQTAVAPACHCFARPVILRGYPRGSRRR